MANYHPSLMERVACKLGLHAWRCDGPTWSCPCCGLSVGKPTRPHVDAVGPASQPDPLVVELAKYAMHDVQCRERCVCGLDELTDALGLSRVVE